MNESITLSNGKEVSFYSSLSYNGITVSLNARLTGDDLALFKKELKESRDVVAIMNESI